MTRDETVELFLQGREAWNAWAERMLAWKAKLQKAGKWTGDKAGHEQNDETKDWMGVAAANFDGVWFLAAPLAEETAQMTNDQTQVTLGDNSFAEFVIPADISFYEATFDRVEFEEVIFRGLANFEGATFRGEAYFSGAEFLSDAHFDRCQFDNMAFFMRTKFKALS